MKAASVVLLLLGLVGGLVSADTLRVTEERDESGHATLVITPQIGKANATQATAFCVKISGPEFNFKPMDKEGHSFLLSADGRTCGCMEKFAVENYRCDCVTLTKQGTLQIYPDVNGAIKPFLKAKNLPVGSEELIIEEVASRQVTLGSHRLTIHGEPKYLQMVVLLKPEGGVEVVKYWFEKEE